MERTDVVRRIHQSAMRLVFVCSGGGSLAASDLLTVPGATRTVIEVSLPYAQAATAHLLGCVPEHFCRDHVARMLAMVAFERGQRLIRAGYRLGEHPDITDLFSGDTDPRDPIGYAPLVGIGCSASLATESPKRGGHRVHIAAQTLRRTILCSLELQPDTRTRWEEERLVADLILNMLARVEELQRRDMAVFPLRVDAGQTPFESVVDEPSDWLTTPLPLGLRGDEQVVVTHVVASPTLIDLFFGQTVALRWHADQFSQRVSADQVVDGTVPVNISDVSDGEPARQLLFPGAFRPIHEGHLKMLNVAQRRLGMQASLEIAIQNVDKPPIDYHDLHQRLNLIAVKLPQTPVWLTQQTEFRHKARAFPRATFIVGADTLTRFAQLSYHNNSLQHLHEAIRVIAQYDGRFLVFARTVRGQRESLATLDVPDMLRSLSDEVAPREFMQDISSTAIRRHSR